MFTIRLVTSIVLLHTILVVYTIIRPPWEGSRFSLDRSFMSLEKLQQMLKKVCIPFWSRMLVCSSLVRSFVSLQMLLAMVKNVFVFLLCPECWCSFFPTIELFSLVARALHILSDLYLICCAIKDLCSIIVEKELCVANLLYSSSYSQTIDLYYS